MQLLLEIAKSPGLVPPIVILLKLATVLPVFVIVTDCELLVVFTF